MRQVPVAFRPLVAKAIHTCGPRARVHVGSSRGRQSVAALGYPPAIVPRLIHGLLLRLLKLAVFVDALHRVMPWGLVPVSVAVR